MKRTKIIPIKWIPENHDTDWDGVSNYRDCQPFNPNRQGKFHTSRFFTKSTRYQDPSMRKSYVERKNQIQEFSIKQKNIISQRMYGRPYVALSTSHQSRVDAVFSMYEKGVTIR